MISQTLAWTSLLRMGQLSQNSSSKLTLHHVLLCCYYIQPYCRFSYVSNGEHNVTCPAGTLTKSSFKNSIRFTDRFTPFKKRPLLIDLFLFQSTGFFLLNHEWFSHTRKQALTRAGIFNFIKIKQKINSLNQPFQSLTLSLSQSALTSLSISLCLFLSLSYLSLFLCLYRSLSLSLSRSLSFSPCLWHSLLIRTPHLSLSFVATQAGHPSLFLSPLSVFWARILLMRLEGHAENAAVLNINLLLFDCGWQKYVVNQLI